MDYNITSTSPTNFYGLCKKPVIVDNKLMRGCAISSPFKLKKMKEEGITQIIDLRNSARIESPFEKLMCNLLGIKYQHCNFSHRLNELPSNDFFETINKLIISNKGKSYVQCEYGKHRTGLVVAIYEKLHTQNRDKKIIENLINNGYKEITKEGKTNKEKKYIGLYQQMMDRYF